MSSQATFSKPIHIRRIKNVGNDQHERKFPWSAWWGVISLLSLLTLLPTHAISSSSEQDEVVSGILESVNEKSNTVQIRNALDQPIFLKITKPHLLEGITPGERVTVVVNEQHEIIKLIETPIPELQSPASP
ncbi:hypothetical protein YTPLAS72_01080 [Nitrospira sp.]|nr:hypothetical protein YTPLAS72_01080 [Nitrospira sp.]